MSESRQGTLQVSDRGVVFTLPRRYRLPVIRGGVTALVLTAAAASVAAISGTGYIPLAIVCGFAAACCAVAYAWQGRFRTVLTPDGITIRGYFSHFVPWAEVTGFAVHDAFAGLSLADDSRPAPPLYRDGGPSGTMPDPGASLGAPGALWEFGGGGRGGGGLRPPANSSRRRGRSTVRVVRRKGRRMLLRAPVVTSWQSDPEFGDKLRLLAQWHHQHAAPPPVAGT
jgi:hypothetical protein